MVRDLSQVRRWWHRQFVGYRVNCESVPVLPADIVRRVWDDPRDIPYLLTWKGRRDGETKEQVRMYRNTLGSDPSGRDSVEIMSRHSSPLQVFIKWRAQPNSGRSLLLRCPECYRPCRALYGFKVGDDGRRLQRS
jgi:hypothetical protein